MKLIGKIGIMVLAIASLTACGDKDAEKKIAALEARLNELEGKKTPSPLAATPTPTPAVEEAKPGEEAGLTVDSLDLEKWLLKVANPQAVQVAKHVAEQPDKEGNDKDGEDHLDQHSQHARVAVEGNSGLAMLNRGGAN